MSSTVVLFHHALGCTPGVDALADRLRSRGLTVLVPDLYGGARFDGLEEGVAHGLAIGFGELIASGVAAVADVDSPVVVGISLGVLPAQCVAQTVPGVRGAVLIGACVPLGEFSDTWPDGVALEVHAASSDPIFDVDGDAEAAAQITAVSLGSRLVRHAGGGHLFVEAGHADEDEAATLAVVEAVVAMTS